MNFSKGIPGYLKNRAGSYLRRRDWSWHLHYRALKSKYKLYQLRNRHSGQRCFIMGNGPSLRDMDLSPLKDEFTIGLNRIYLLFDKLGFIPSYYVAVNSLVVEQCGAEIADIPTLKFISWRSRQYIPFDRNLIFLRTIYSSDYIPSFAFDPINSVWEGNTVTYVAMQIAWYLGFKEVILIGVDHSFQTEGVPNTTVLSEGDDLNHFDPNYFGKGFRWQLPDLHTSEFAYQVARFEYERTGRRILDATVNGKLTVFPKVAFESLF